MVCAGGSSKIRMPGGISMSALISSRMPPRPEMYVLAVDQPALDVVVAAERVEVVLLVVVERRLLAQPAEHRVRVGVDVDVVRVVVHRSVMRSVLSVEQRPTIRDGVSGSRVTVTPNGASASATALTTAGGAPIAPPSPTPLYPPGPGLGVSTWPYSMTGTSAAVGSR